MMSRGVLVELAEGREYLVTFDLSQSGVAAVLSVHERTGRGWEEAVLGAHDRLIAKGLALQGVAAFTQCCGLRVVAPPIGVQPV